MHNYKTKTDVTNQFDAISIKLASPERIKEWSFGEVTKPETINYRTQRSERNGLFDEKIFGPDKDFECYCGKYRGIRYKSIICEKCGVEITRSIVRRERMGHIELATPVAHIWFLKNVPSRISLVMGIPVSDLEKVVYFAGYIVTSVSEVEKARILKDLESEFKAKTKVLHDDKSKLALKELALATRRDIETLVPGRVLDEIEYHRSSMKYPTIFEARIGAEAIYDILKDIDLEKLLKELEAELVHSPSTEIPRLNKRISTVQWMINSGNRPEWMFLVRIPVIPPAIRPMVPLDGGRYATSDVNDLYRRVINRNNRLKKLKEINAPDVILRNEKRILQEAVDALIDNTIRHSSVSGNQSQRRPLKSLSDNLKGKRGLFRQNLLGKRVDYSGRSVIVVGPELKLHQCGLPKHMALELFKPFIISELLKRELSYNIPGARRLIEDAIPEVWAILEEVIRGKYVLLNRAPTLHRLGIQAFQPVLIEGNAIQLHPLVCTAFNADFDGDQMAVHVPLSEEAQAEARLIMAADKNILKPGNGEPVVSAKLLDIVLGTFWMTRTIDADKGEGRYYSNPNSAITAYEFGVVSLRAKIFVLPTNTERYKHFEGKLFETSVGRLLFNGILPKDYPFLNHEMSRKKMSELVDDLIERYGIENIPPVMDKIKDFGFRYATYSGVTWGLGDVKIPSGKKVIIDKGRSAVSEVVGQYRDGLLSEHERITKSVEIWQGIKSEVEKLIPATLGINDSVYDMTYSEARGSLGNLNQMAGMKGIIQNVAGVALEFPILSCYKEGLTPLEYFITTHGSRKGLTDTALNTAKAGYLTRRLFDVAQDEIVTEEDCGAKDGTIIRKKTASGIEMPLSKNIKGRFLATDLLDGAGRSDSEKPSGSTSSLLFKRGHLFTKIDTEIIDKSSIEAVNVRSPLACKSIHGVCIKCYGVDLGNNKPIELGEAVGTVAAQAIGEPGTQLTMRTFHAGGIASAGGDITAGLPRVEEIFEKRKPKVPAIISHLDGVVTEVKVLGHDKLIVVTPDIGETKASPRRGGASPSTKLGVKKLDNEYTVQASRFLLVKIGQNVKKGDVMTDGSVDLDELFRYAGREKTENYIIHEVSKLYELQGATVSHKHIELIVRQMFARRKIKDSGDTRFTHGDIVEVSELTEINNLMKEKGLEEATADAVIMGITEVSLSRSSFLSAASFQHTPRVLIQAAIRGAKDNLVGLKENVIIGRLIPAGTSFKGGYKEKLICEAMSIQSKKS
ncbi:MAG: DNA-directed RNA polymerase subunit beta' [bacterium]|nr:DNA-directed RNA polymerase subunit beta' [bacterium]